MKQIGQAILLYANENAGATPDSFATALRTQDLVPEVFVCPTSSADPAGSVEAFAADPSAKHCSYLYVGDRLPTAFSETPADAILALEPRENHDGDFANVLFGDGHVEVMHFAPRGKPTPWWDAVQAQIGRGDRPVRWPTTRPAN